MVSRGAGRLHLSVQRSGGRLLRAAFSTIPLHRRDSSGALRGGEQGRRIGPGTVAAVIRHARANGWRPDDPGTPLVLPFGVVDGVRPLVYDAARGEPLEHIATEQVASLRYDVSLDPRWRSLLLAERSDARHPIPERYHGLSADSKKHSLRYEVFRAGETVDGLVVFGIASVEFPHVVMHTYNNPRVP